MNLSFKNILPQDFSDTSRVWIYQSDRPFTSDEVLHIQKMLADFVLNWKSHGVPVKGYANVFFDQFIILMADEAATGVSGCSIDSSVHVLQEIGQQYNTDLFNWQSLGFVINNHVKIISRQQFDKALESNHITAETLFFNNVVTTKKEVEENWIIPVRESWLKTKIKQPV